VQGPVERALSEGLSFPASCLRKGRQVGNEPPQAQDLRLSADLAEYSEAQRRRDGGSLCSPAPLLRSGVCVGVEDPREGKGREKDRRREGRREKGRRGQRENMRTHHLFPMNVSLGR